MSKRAHGNDDPEKLLNLASQLLCMFANGICECSALKRGGYCQTVTEKATRIMDLGAARQRLLDDAAMLDRRIPAVRASK